MTDMGKHSTPVDGVPVAANGHALAPFTITSPLQVREAGPVSPWPQPRNAGRVRHAAAAVSARRAWLAAVPVVLVNAVAFYGQLAFLRTHLPAPSPVQVLVAVALESIAVYLAWQAHLAQLADDSALRLRLAAYAMAAVIAAMNFSHYAGPGWRPTFAALAFALCSAVSPWLWSVHSRRESRDALKAKGLIEPHSVRLGVTRWVWHPLRSPRVMWHATWQGETDPASAIALLSPATEDALPDDGDSDEDGDGTGDGEPGASDEDDDKDAPLPPPPDDEVPRQRQPSGGDKVRDTLKRHRALRKRLLEGDAATRKAAKAEAAEKAGVSVRTVERVLSEMAGTS
jgi:hypothetical protein